MPRASSSVLKLYARCVKAVYEFICSFDLGSCWPSPFLIAA
jgi:hypothetical protein